MTVNNKMLSEFGLTAITASELEFYLFGYQEKNLTSFWDDVRHECSDATIPIFNLEKERGKEQHEVSLMPSSPEKTISDTKQLKRIISKIAIQHNMRPDFSAKPLADDFGSGLHIHIHLENSEGTNQFFKDDAMMSDALKYSVGGLLLWMPDTMPIFAPNKESYQRFAEGSNAPLTVSWGANNRTTALRLPDSPKHNKRIEHRVAGADADVELVINTILASIHYGLKHKILPDNQIYGDARLELYHKLRFPASLDAANQSMQLSVLPIKEYGLLT